MIYIYIYILINLCIYMYSQEKRMNLSNKKAQCKQCVEVCEFLQAIDVLHSKRQPQKLSVAELYCVLYPKRQPQKLSVANMQVYYCHHDYYYYCYYFCYCYYQYCHYEQYQYQHSYQQIQGLILFCVALLLTNRKRHTNKTKTNQCNTQN